MLLHAKHAGNQGHSSIVLRTVDTDVVVIAVSQIQVLTITKIITTNLYNLSEKYGSGADLQIV